jgi:hypothetical protein
VSVRVRLFGLRRAQRLSVALFVTILLASGATGLAQDVSFPATGTVVRNAPMFWLRDDTRAPIVLLPAGVSVQVLGREGAWYKVVYHDARLGDQVGYVAPFDVQIDPRTGSQAGGSGTAPISQRGYFEGRGLGFPQKASNDSTRLIGDGLFREEVFAKPARWLQLAAGIDLRANSHDQVEDKWRLDFDDRGVLRPRAAVHRLSAAVTTNHLTVDLGKQFIRWGRADILSPTDRFAPRDYVNVIGTEFLPVLGARASTVWGSETFEVVWLPRMTPSRLPLLDQRWTVAPPAAAGFVLTDAGAVFPKKSEQGVRWSHAGRFEMGLSFFDGFNHLPDLTGTVDPVRGVIAITRSYPDLRTYGGELAIPTALFNLKAEGAYFTSSTSEEYVLYVVEVERQTGEWLLDVGYAGDVVTKSRGGVFSFAAERGVARSIIGRVSYTIDPTRTVAIEAAVRQNGRGAYTRGEYSQAFGQHWRLTLAGVGIAGHDDNFLGQYHRNSHGTVALRFSF